MLNPKISKLLNDQINKEFYSSYLYLDMSNYYYDNNLKGFGNWFAIQTQEEYAHAMLFLKYMQNNGEKITLEAIAAPGLKYANLKAPLEEALKHEYFITSSINDIYAAAYEVKDFRTMQFLDWFVKEQGEEEQNTDDLCKRFDLFGSDPKSLYLLDNELSTRVFNPPSLVI
ncbi:MAG TPA: ferritin [Paludibacteraceae bacterium]|nr:ferritin [Paludibacteraceae bacterium]